MTGLETRLRRDLTAYAEALDPSDTAGITAIRRRILSQQSQKGNPMNVPRWLNPSTNPALYSAAVGVAFAIWQALQVQAASGPLTWPQVGRVAAGVVFAAVVAWQRGKTTPVADPKDANGVRLVPLPPLIAGNLSAERVPEDDLSKLKAALADHAVALAEQGRSPDDALAASRTLTETQHASQDDVTRAFVAAQLPAAAPQPEGKTTP